MPTLVILATSDDALAEAARHVLGEKACRDVGTAPRRVADDEADRFVRESLRLYGEACGEACGEAGKRGECIAKSRIQLALLMCRL
mgnify:CR=1 FL=1